MVVFNPAAHLEVSSESLEARYRVASQTLQRSDMRRCLTTMFLFFVQGLRGPVGSPGTPGQAGMSVCTQTFLICAGFSFNRNCKWWGGLKAPEHPPPPYPIRSVSFVTSCLIKLFCHDRVAFASQLPDSRVRVCACARVRVLVSVRVRDCACACVCNCEWTEERV